MKFSATFGAEVGLPEVSGADPAVNFIHLDKGVESGIGESGT
jgi:hypothetical protein